MAPNMGRGITAPANDEDIKTGATEMQTLGSTTAFAIDDLESSINSDLAGKASTGYVDAGLAGATSYTSTVESASLARDDALAADIAGMEGMTYVGAWQSGAMYRVNDVVTHGGDSWARLTAGDTGEPGVSAADWGMVARQGAGGGFGDLVESAVVGLYDTVDGGVEARLAALEYDSGERDITALVVGRTSGRLLIERTGHTVQMTFDDLRVEDQGSSYYSWGSLLPSGWCAGPATGYRYFPLSPTGAAYSPGPIRVSRYGDLGVYNMSEQSPIRGTVSWTTRDPVPTTPLGDPA